MFVAISARVKSLLSENWLSSRQGRANCCVVVVIGCLLVGAALGVGTAPPRAPGCGARGGGRKGRATGCTGGRRGAGPRGTGSRRAGWSGSLLDLVGELDVHVPGVRAFADLDGLAVLVGPPGQPALHGGAGPGEAVLLEPL